MVLVARSQVALVTGDLPGCAAALDGAEALAREGAGPFVLATVLNLRTTLALLRGDDAAADLEASLFAASAVTAETSLVDVSFLPDREIAAAALAEVRRDLADGEFDRWWARGRALDAEGLAAVIAEVSERPAPG